MPRLCAFSDILFLKKLKSNDLSSVITFIVTSDKVIATFRRLHLKEVTL
ncbi:MAG: hypothetical protein O7D30_03620 [Rickettsia endosymbiont of Ixodes persulcatus]|nr:hypothetical protein [Rickettsia endosymbiont of Ixodes persulcatus]